MRVERYTAGPDWRVVKGPRKYPPLGKPAIGIWISVPGSDDDWPAWCRAEGFNVEALRYRHRYDLDTTDVLVIDTLAKLDAFHAAHAKPFEHDPKFMTRGNASNAQSERASVAKRSRPTCARSTCCSVTSSAPPPPPDHRRRSPSLCHPPRNRSTEHVPRLFDSLPSPCPWTRSWIAPKRADSP